MGLFDLDGPIYRICNMIFELFTLNILWIIFSLPIVTMGAATTALFYVCGKKARKEDYYLFRDFWKSFKQNFKQATIIWIILLCSLFILVFNIVSIHLLGGSMTWLLFLQIVLVIQVIVISNYIFPIVCRFHMSLSNCFKTAFFFGGKHIITTVLSILCFITVLLTTYLTGFFILFFMSVYALISSYMMQNVFKKYFNEENFMAGVQESTVL